MSTIITLRWDEPDEGGDAVVALLDEGELRTVKDAVAWLEEESGEEWGGTVARVDLFETAAHGGDFLTLSGVLRYLADECRYTSGENVYEKDCPQFEAIAIERR